MRNRFRISRIFGINSVTAARDAAKAMAQLQQRDVRQLPVMRNGSLVGLLRRRDLVKWLQLHSERGLS
jgi:CBS domain-containing protein